MAIRTLNWCGDLDCDAVIPVNALVCVPLSITAPGQFGQNGIIISVITAVRPSTCADPCGLCHFVYTIEYDDAQLLPGHALVQSSVKAVFCETCLVDAILRINQLIQPCTLSTETLNLTTDPDGCILGNVNISSDLNNCIVSTPSGLYVACGSLNVADTNSVDLTLGAGPILSADVRISADANNCLESRFDGLYNACPAAAFIQSISDTLTVDLDVTATDLTANVKVSAVPGNNLQIFGDGLFVEPNTADTNTVDLVLTAGLLTANVFISADPNNCLVANLDGLFVACPDTPFISAVADTPTVDLSVGAQILTADVKISADVGNIITASLDGIFAPTPPAAFISAVADTPTVDLNVGAGILTAAVEISADAGNIITAHADGIYAPTPSSGFITSVSDTPTVDLTVTVDDLTADVKISADALNLLEEHGDGLWVPAQDGWIPFNDTLTYVSSSSFTIPGDWTNRLDKGDRIKVFNVSQKYFYVLSASFGAGITTVNIYAGTTHVLANAVITDPFFSHDESPTSFPDYFDYTPSYIPGGGMTFSPTTVNNARFSISGRKLTLALAIVGTTSGVSSNVIIATLPIVAAIGGASGAVVYPGAGSNRAGQVFIGTTADFYIYDASAFGLGTDRQIICLVDYQI